MIQGVVPDEEVQMENLGLFDELEKEPPPDHQGRKDLQEHDKVSEQQETMKTID